MISKYGLIYSFSKTLDTLEVYFSDEEIIRNERKEDVDWILYWHSDGENIWMKEKIIGLGVSENNIITRHW